MHQDQKIGLSLAVLLIGFAAAFCFRHEPLLAPQPLVLVRADELDSRIEHLPIRAYTEREGVTGPGARRGSVDRPAAAEGPVSDVFEVGPAPAIARHESDRGNLVPLFAGPPEPLRIAPDRSPGRPERFPPAAEPASPRGASVSELPIGPAAAVQSSVWLPPVVPTIKSNAAPVSPVDARGDDVPSSADGSRAHPDDRLPLVTYEVCSGDTLSKLAERFLGSSRRYEALYEANRDVLSSPHALRPGMVLRIPVAR